jgi:hypothetical protein
MTTDLPPRHPGLANVSGTWSSASCGLPATATTARRQGSQLARKKSAQARLAKSKLNDWAAAPFDCNGTHAAHACSASRGR